MSKAALVLRSGDSIIGKALEQLPLECPTSIVGKMDVTKIVLVAGGEITENISPVIKDEGNLRQYLISVKGMQGGGDWEYPVIVYNFATGQVAIHRSIDYIECEVTLVNENVRPADDHIIRAGTTIETNVVVMHGSQLDKIAGRVLGCKYEGAIKLLNFTAEKVVFTDDREIAKDLTTGPSQDGPSSLYVVTVPMSRGATSGVMTMASIDMQTGKVSLHDGAVAIEGTLKFVNEVE